MGAFLLAAGTKGKRYALENSEVMLHQVIGSAGGQASDVIIAANFARRTKDRINRILAENIGKPVEEIARDTERDNWMFAEDALAYGVVDEIIKKK
jgi:ATP-dependent Clp protease protease subunit